MIKPQPALGRTPPPELEGEQTRPCHRCQCETTQTLHQNITANGTRQVGFVCLKCKSWVKHTKGIWISHKEIDDSFVRPDLLPIVSHGRPPPFCARCYTPHAELHHWAPQSLFNDADSWPTDYLCRSCHEHWHETATPSVFAKMKSHS